MSDDEVGEARWQLCRLALARELSEKLKVPGKGTLLSRNSRVALGQGG